MLELWMFSNVIQRTPLPGNDHYHAMDKDDLQLFRDNLDRVFDILGVFFGALFWGCVFRVLFWGVFVGSFWVLLG